MATQMQKLSLMLSFIFVLLLGQSIKMNLDQAKLRTMYRDTYDRDGDKKLTLDEVSRWFEKEFVDKSKDDRNAECFKVGQRCRCAEGGRVVRWRDAATTPARRSSSDSSTETVTASSAMRSCRTSWTRPTRSMGPPRAFGSRVATRSTTRCT